MNVRSEDGLCCNYECGAAVVSRLPAFKRGLLDGTQANLPARFTSFGGRNCDSLCFRQTANRGLGAHFIKHSCD